MMTNKVNKYSNKSSFAKLLLFNWIQIRNSGLFWILLFLNFISFPLTSCLIYYLTNNIYHYMIFIILVPLISSFIQIMFLVYWLYLENKYNSINYKLFCSQYSRFHISLARITFIFISLVPTIIINALFTIFFIVIDMMQLFGTLLVSTVLINSFVYIIIICLLVLISDKIGRTAYIFLGLFLAVATLGASLISRPFIINETNNYLNYYNVSNETMDGLETSKLVSNNSNDILVTKSINVLTQDDLIYDVNKKSVFYNNFIPSEWLLTFYSSLFSLFNFELDYLHSPYDLLNINVNNSVNKNLNNLSNFYAIRPIDINFTSLTDNEYKTLIISDISKIINKYNLVNNQTLFNSIESAFSIGTIEQSIKDWNTLSIDTINFLKDATGINTEFNQLFYLIKYDNLINDRLNGIFDDLALIYNQDISNLFETIFTSSITDINIFQVQNFADNQNLVLKTSKLVDEIYPMIESVNVQKPITLDYKNFLKNQLIIWNEDSNNNIVPSFLSMNLKYIALDSNQLKLFNEKVKDQESWNNLVDIAFDTTYDTATSLINYLKGIFNTSNNQLFEYKWFNGNSLNLSEFNAILNPINGNQNGYGEIFIILYIILFALLSWLTIRKYQSYYKQQ